MTTSKLWNKDGWWRGHEGVGREVGVEVEHIYIMLTFHSLQQLQHQGQGWGWGGVLTFHSLQQLQHWGQGGIGSKAGGGGWGGGLPSILSGNSSIGGSCTGSCMKRLADRTLWAVYSKMAFSIQKQSTTTQTNSCSLNSNSEQHTNRDTSMAQTWTSSKCVTVTY